MPPITRKNSCKVCHKNDRLALALEVVHREVAIDNDILRKRYKHMCSSYYREVRMKDIFKKENAELHLKCAIRDVIIKDLKNTIDRYEPAINEVNNIYRYVAILEDFIQKSLVPCTGELPKRTTPEKHLRVGNIRDDYLQQ